MVMVKNVAQGRRHRHRGSPMIVLWCLCSILLTVNPIAGLIAFAPLAVHCKRYSERVKQPQDTEQLEIPR